MANIPQMSEIPQAPGIMNRVVTLTLAIGALLSTLPFSDAVTALPVSLPVAGALNAARRAESISIPTAWEAGLREPSMFDWSARPAAQTGYRSIWDANPLVLRTLCVAPRALIGALRYRRPDAAQPSAAPAASVQTSRAALIWKVAGRTLTLPLPAFRSRTRDFRTDRHNNPTAMTTEFASQGGLVEGKDFVRGDSFKGPDGKTYYTAKLLGDPIDTTIRAIDRGGIYTKSGQARWAYINRIPKAAHWAAMTQQQKAAIVGKMYRMEGGSGRLANRPPAAEDQRAALGGL
jgi:hypothetical protein